MYKIYCTVIVALFAYVSFTGRSIFSPSSKRQWTKPGKRSYYYHK